MIENFPHVVETPKPEKDLVELKVMDPFTGWQIFINGVKMLVGVTYANNYLFMVGGRTPGRTHSIVKYKNITAKFRENTSMRFRVTVRKLNITNRRTDRWTDGQTDRETDRGRCNISGQ